MFCLIDVVKQSAGGLHIWLDKYDIAGKAQGLKRSGRAGRAGREWLVS